MMNSNNIRQQITEKIINSLQAGSAPWRKPWSFGEGVFSGFPSNFATPSKHYHGVNPMILLMAGFGSRYWGTLNAWKNQRGFYIPATEEPTNVVYYVFIDKKVNGNVIMRNGKAEKVPILRFYPLYNAEQVRVVEPEWLAKKKRPELLAMAKSLRVKTDDTKLSIACAIHDKFKSRLDRYLTRLSAKDFGFKPADDFIVSTRANIRNCGQKAFYVYEDDFIQVPEKRHFSSMSGYYETVFHEMLHWCEKKGRVGKKEGHNYAFGELVAEIGACYLCFEIGVPHAEEMLENSSKYVDAWLKEMGNDPKYIFEASSQASKAVTYLLDLCSKPEKKVA